MIALPLAPAERAERLTGRDTLSFSSISTYQACPLKWMYRYVAGLPEETRPANLVFGSAIHAALQHHFEALLVHGSAPELEELVAAYRVAWAQETADPTRVVTFAGDDSPESLDRLATKMLMAFQHSDLARPRGRILAIEEELVGEISPDCPPLLARLDLAVESDDRITITDFKTSRTRWSPDQAEYAATQLLVYRTLAKSIVGEQPVALQFGILTKTKTPSVEVHPVGGDPRNLDRVRAILERVWAAIADERFYPAPSPIHCPSCPYRRACREWPG